MMKTVRHVKNNEAARPKSRQAAILRVVLRSETCESPGNGQGTVRERSGKQNAACAPKTDCLISRGTPFESPSSHLTISPSQCAGAGQCCLEIDPFPLPSFLCTDEGEKNVAKNAGISAFVPIPSHSNFFWHAACCSLSPEAVVCVVGPDSRVNSAGVKGGEGQESRLFPLIWVRGPSGKLLPRNLFRQVPRWKGERPRAFPLSFCAESGIESRSDSAGMHAQILFGIPRRLLRHGFQRCSAILAYCVFLNPPG